MHNKLTLDTASIKPQRLPRWMKSQMPKGKTYSQVFNLIQEHNLHTICTSGNCPNKGECWNAGTASFMILGNKCTRNCRFCSVPNQIPEQVDWNEPERLAQTIFTLKLKHAVITSVTRDDLPDGGAHFWATTIRALKAKNPQLTIEALIPDFNGIIADIQQVIDSNPEVISHNLETIERLTPKIRSTARYNRSLKLLKQITDSGITAKSGIMVGIGETTDEVLKTMDDLRYVGVKVMTIGQYLQPNAHLLPVVSYITPDTFKFYETEGIKRGFAFIESSPLVRSSYHAERHASINKVGL